MLTVTLLATPCICLQPRLSHGSLLLGVLLLCVLLLCVLLLCVLLQVVEYLKEATLAGTASSPEAHIAALQSAIAIQQQEFKMTLDNVQKQLHGKAGKGAEAKASDGLEAAATTSIGELLKSQFGPVVVSGCAPRRMSQWAVRWTCTGSAMGTEERALCAVGEAGGCAARSVGVVHAGACGFGFKFKSVSCGCMLL